MTIEVKENMRQDKLLPSVIEGAGGNMEELANATTIKVMERM